MEGEKRVLKKTLLIVHCCILVLMLGCWDRHEIDELAYVIAIGIDEGEGDDFLVTYQIANPKEAGEDDVISDIISIRAPDFLSARDLVVAFVSREVVFTHTKVLIVSETFARRDEFVNFIKPAIRERQLSRKVNLIVSKEKASDFMRNNEPTLETRPHKFFELMTDRWEDTGLVPDSTLHSLFHRMEEDSGVFLATYSTTVQEEAGVGQEDDYIPGEVRIQGSNPTQTVGSAVIKEGKMIGSLTGEETRFSLLLRPKKEIEKMIASYPDPIDEEYKITVRFLAEEGSNITINTKKRAPVIHVRTPLRLEVLSIESDIDYVEDLEKQEVLKMHIKSVIEAKVNTFIRKTQKEFKAEPFRWSLPARRTFLTNREYEQYRWMENYPYAEVHFEVDLQFKEFGKQLAPTDMEEVKG
ncbi:hypothetical protein BKP35_12410 [Anaerobacillus arseniciselenatis]|uniref:Uncharacterized protein n=1 Tax=Anaerobacillus arseniciselenatis TaxID=85682 RepID=A0A1S2LFJ0_9BACI|nr:hypothetical protein BKP35_12410 [Anaerobacillus arseniciselenatis]